MTFSDNAGSFTDFESYRLKAWETAVYPLKGKGNTAYVLMQLCAECNELAAKFTKQNRKGVFTKGEDEYISNWNPFTDEDDLVTIELVSHKTFVDDIVAEAGDIFWYIAAFCSEARLNLEAILYNYLKDQCKEHGWEKGVTPPKLQNSNFLTDYRNIRALVDHFEEDFSWQLEYMGIWQSLKNLILESSNVLESFPCFGDSYSSMVTAIDQVDTEKFASFVFTFLEVVSTFVIPLMYSAYDKKVKGDYTFDTEYIKLSDEDISAGFSIILSRNIEKLTSRVERGVIHGDGDNR